MRSDARKKLAERVHNHAPYRPTCNERRLDDGQLRGACLNDDGSDRLDDALGAALILLDRTEQALRIVKADLDAQAVQLDEIRRVAAEWAEEDWPQVDDYLRGHAAGMRAAGGAILGRLG
jgi:hypothetical protein